jgi:hypothetical protein
VADLTKAAEDVRDFYQNRASFQVAGKTIAAKNICEKVLSGLAAIKDVGAAATSLNPYASSAWGAVQFLITGPINHHETRELCWAELPRIIGLIGQYQTFEVVYEQQDLRKSKDVLEAALIKLYTSLLQYQIAIVIFTATKTAVLKAYRKTKEHSQIQDILNEVEEQRKTISRIEPMISRQIDNSNWAELKRAVSLGRASGIFVYQLERHIAKSRHYIL